MDRKGLSFVTLLVSATLLSGASSAEFGTTEEARGLLERAVTAVKKDPAAAIRSFNYNAEPFRDRDLFVFCFNGRDGSSRHTRLSSDGTCARCAMPIAKSFGAEMYSDARDSRVTEVSFESPLPGTTKLAPKRAYVMRIGDQVCGVSAYQFSGESGHTQ